MPIAQTLADLPTPATAAPGTEERRARRRIAEALILQGTSAAPIQHWTQGLARMAQAGLGGYEEAKLGKEERAQQDRIGKLLAGMPGLEASPASGTQVPSAAPASNAIPASIRTNNPGAQYPGPSATAYGSTGHDVIGGGHKIARFNSPEEGAAAQFNLLSRGYTGMPLSAAIQKWSGGNSAPQYVQMVSKATGLTPDTVITPELLRSPQGVQLVQAMAQHEAGRPYPMTPEQWQAAQSRAFGGQGAPAPQTAPAASPAPAGGAQPAIDPQSAQYIKALMASGDPRLQQYGMQLYQSAITRAQPQYGFQTVGENLVRTEAKTGRADVVPGLSPAKPTYGVIGKDQFGNEQYGWIDPATRSTTPGQAPATQPATPGQPGVIQAEVDKIIAAGGDPKTARAEMTKRGMGETLPAEAAGRLAMMETAQKGMAQARQVFEREWNRKDFAQSAAARAGVGALAGEVGEARRTVRSAIESALRVMTGAAAPEAEVSRYADMYMPNEFDSPQSAKQKLDMLEQFMSSARANVLQGRTLPGAAQPAAAPAPAPAPTPTPKPTDTRSVGGKSYVKIDGQWYEQ
jgi:hypothetical protein